MSKEKAASLTNPRFSKEKLGGDLEGGMGIGLPICIRLLRLMDGGVSIKSQPGKGAKVFFGLSLKEASRNERAPARAAGAHYS
jgi:signal transduction histidine kinase